jgi:hypothetical protein
VFPNLKLTKTLATRTSFAVALISSLVSLSGPLAEAASATTVASCPATTLVKPFVKYGDEGNYSLVAGGSFEGSMGGWTLSSGAKVASGGEASAVGGSLGKSSLALSAGASAQSPFTCVEPNDRTFRFFAHSEGASATILAWVVYESPLGNIAVPVKSFNLTSAWEPSPIIHSGAAVVSTIYGGTAHLALRFTAVTGSARIDDVYLDPRMR